VQPVPITNRGAKEVDLILGKKRIRPNDKIRMDFSKCPLALTYPSWDLFLESLNKEQKETTPVKLESFPPQVKRQCG
jgi:hypothetical protein